MGHNREKLPGPAVLVVALVTAAGAAVLALTVAGATEALRAEPAAAVAFIALTLALQLFSIPLRSGGYIGVSAIGILAAAFLLGPGAAMLVGALAGVTRPRRALVLHRRLFDAGQFALSAAAAGYFHDTFAARTSSVGGALAVALLAGVIYAVVNNVLLCTVISLAEETPIRAVWHERFRAGRVFYLAFGPVALALAAAFENVAVAGLVAASVLAAVVVAALRQHIARQQLAAAAVASRPRS